MAMDGDGWSVFLGAMFPMSADKRLTLGFILFAVRHSTGKLNVTRRRNQSSTRTT